MAYRANVTDKQQADIEQAEDDSAIRVFWFDGKAQQTGQVKSFRALDLQPQGNTTQRTTDAQKMVAGSVAGGIGSHNDKPHRFDTPGKA
jgi:hypothetical protein